jgi:hypothetical protein
MQGRSAITRTAGLLCATVAALAAAPAGASAGTVSFDKVFCQYVPVWMNVQVDSYRARATGAPARTPVEFTGTDALGSRWTSVVASNRAGTAVDEARPLEPAGWGTFPVTVTATYDADGDGVRTDPVGPPVTVAAAGTAPCDYTFSGFGKPVGRDGRARVKAGKVVPLTWRATMPDGTPIANRSHVIAVVSSLPSEPEPDVIFGSFDEPLVDPDALHYLGDGRWRYDWRTERSWRGTSRRLSLWLSDGPDGMIRHAHFTFT